MLVKNADHTWWGTEVYGGPYLDRIELHRPWHRHVAAVAAAAEADEIDVTYQTDGDFVEVFDGLGWTKSEAVTSATIAVRFNQDADLYKDAAVRKALQLMRSTTRSFWNLAMPVLAQPAENHHVCPIHPEYAELAPLTVDPAAAKAMIDEAGMADHEFELISIDDDWQAATCDAVAAQIRDAGINIKRTILPGSTFWNDWTKYPFSATEWNMRPLGVQVLALAYKSRRGLERNAPLHNAEFDASAGRSHVDRRCGQAPRGDGQDRKDHAR